MKGIENKIMLITYADSMGGSLQKLDTILNTYFHGIFGGLHVLPFYPSSGDRGFAVINYDQVDPAFGSWEDIDRLGEKYYLMSDFMLNHISVRSREFQDYIEKGEESAFCGMFIDWEQFWPGGEPSKEDLEKLYRRRLNAPYLTFRRKDGKEVKLWNTFFNEQIDINPYSPATQNYYERNLSTLAKHAALIRFDAFAYTSKKPGTNCFFVEPDIWDILEIGTKPLHPTGTEMLPEIHADYQIQQKMASHGYWVYDFALPMLLLHALLSGRTDRLVHWLKICPRKQFTTLDTHDGIGVIDVSGLLSDTEIDFVRERVDRFTADAKPYLTVPGGILKTSGKKARQYQLASTYYSALGCNDKAYQLARIVQLFAPGIPQVYYVGLLAGKNDIEALKQGAEGRSINRHNYSEEEILKAVQSPMLQKLYSIMRFRNKYPAFNGTVSVSSHAAGILKIDWEKEGWHTSLYADFSDMSWSISCSNPAYGDSRQIFSS